MYLLLYKLKWQPYNNWLTDTKAIWNSKVKCLSLSEEFWTTRCQYSSNILGSAYGNKCYDRDAYDCGIRSLVCMWTTIAMEIELDGLDEGDGIGEY